jgi:hypothetical protein
MDVSVYSFLIGIFCTFLELQTSSHNHLRRFFLFLLSFSIKETLPKNVSERLEPAAVG